MIERHIPADLLACSGPPAEAPDLSTVGALSAALVEAVTGWRECGGRLSRVRALLQMEAGAPPSP